ncbi:MAG: PepSY-associated TM helix domain-containing protein [Novosphingobium sp.]
MLLIAHRWAGLAITLVLVTTGLTGAILPYKRELNRMAAPRLWHAEPPSPRAKLLSGVELMHRVEQQTGGRVSYMPLVLEPGLAQAVFVSRRPGGVPLGFREVIVDPYTGEIRARLRYADLRDGLVNIVPALVNFHYSLALGTWGRFLLGIAALIWAVECLVGIWLSLPNRRAGERLSQTLKRWRSAWGLRRRQGGKVLARDVHRATGLWLWPVMLVFAWSAVAFNLAAVHDPVQKFFGANGLYEPVINHTPDEGPPMSAERAMVVGERLMAEQARERDFTVRAPLALSFNPAANAMGYYALTSLDGPTDMGSTAVWFDDVSGRLLEFRAPFGATKADAIDKSLRMLHTADLFGWPYKLFVSLVGLATAGVAIAGLASWLWRRSGSRGTIKQESRS